MMKILSADIKRLTAERAFDLHPDRFFDHKTHVLYLCGKPLDDDMRVGDSISFNRGNSVFRVFHRDHVPVNKAQCKQERLCEGRGYVRLFDALARASEHKERRILRQKMHLLMDDNSDDEDEDLEDPSKAFKASHEQR